MTRAHFMVGVAVLLGLAAGGAQLVFGQRSDRAGDLPGPVPSKLPITGLVAPAPPQGGPTAPVSKGVVLPDFPVQMPEKQPTTTSSKVVLPELPGGPVMPMLPSEPEQGPLAPQVPAKPNLLNLPLPSQPVAQAEVTGPQLLPLMKDSGPVLPMPSAIIPAQAVMPPAGTTSNNAIVPPLPMPAPVTSNTPPPAIQEKGPGLGGIVPAETKTTPTQSEVKSTHMMELPNDAQTNSATVDNPTGRQEPSVSLEWVGPPAARLNQATTYQIIAKNISGGAVHNVIVRYRIPQGVQITGHEPRGLAEGSVLTWDLGAMAPAQEKRIDLQLLPEAKAVITCQASVTFTGSSTFKVQVREPKLFLKASGPQQVIQGDVATVTLIVSNPGDGVAEHVKVKAILPEGLEHARGKMFEQDLGTLAPGENRSVQVACLARTGGPQIIECLAMADSGLNAKDAAKVDVVQPRLDLIVTGPKLRYLDRHAVYLLKVTNPGSALSNNVTITHQISQGFKFLTATNGGRHDAPSRSVSWFIGDLGPNESREVSFEAVAVNLGEHRHKTIATASRGLKSEFDGITRVEGLSALLMELVDTDDPVEIGSDTSYEIRVTNTGSKTETDLELVCTIPEKMEFRGAKCVAGCNFRVEGRDIIFEKLPRLAPRADVVYRVVVRGVAAGDLRFRARIRADGLTEPVLREESTKVYGDEVVGKTGGF